MIFEIFLGCTMTQLLLALCVITYRQFRNWWYDYRYKKDEIVREQEEPSNLGPLFSPEAFQVIQEQARPGYNWIKAPQLVQITLDEYQENFESEPIQATYGVSITRSIDH